MSKSLKNTKTYTYRIAKATKLLNKISTGLVKLALHSTHTPPLVSLITVPITLAVALPLSLAALTMQTYLNYKDRDDISLGFFSWFWSRTKENTSGFFQWLGDGFKSLGYAMTHPTELPTLFRRWRARKFDEIEQAEISQNYSQLSLVTSTISTTFTGIVGALGLASITMPFFMPIIASGFLIIAGIFSLRSEYAMMKSHDFKKENQLEQHDILKKNHTLLTEHPNDFYTLFDVLCNLEKYANNQLLFHKNDDDSQKKLYLDLKSKIQEYNQIIAKNPSKDILKNISHELKQLHKNLDKHEALKYHEARHSSIKSKIAMGSSILGLVTAGLLIGSVFFPPLLIGAVGTAIASFITWGISSVGYDWVRSLKNKLSNTSEDFKDTPEDILLKSHKIQEHDTPRPSLRSKDKTLIFDDTHHEIHGNQDKNKLGLKYHVKNQDESEGEDEGEGERGEHFHPEKKH